jgi:hypothetical protein
MLTKLGGRHLICKKKMDNDLGHGITIDIMENFTGS